MDNGLRLVLIFVLIVCSAPGWSMGTLHCGTKLIEPGMDKAQVQELCGEPTGIEGNGGVWLYDRDPSELVKVVRFNGGQVEFIDERPRSAGDGDVPRE